MRVFPEYDGPMVTWPRVEAVPHAAAVLAALQPQWLLALATNAEASTEADIWAALSRVELDRWLDRVYCFRGVGHKKSSPAFFTHVLTDLALDPQQVVMVGDDFAADVLGANRCGIRALWLNVRSDEVRQGECYGTIHDLRALPSTLVELMGTTI